MAPPVGLPADLEALRLPALGHGLELGSWWLPESLAAELGGLGDWEMKFLGLWMDMMSKERRGKLSGMDHHISF